jgi:hypothetical protein
LIELDSSYEPKRDMTSTTSASEVTFRAALPADIPRMSEMIAAAELPPIFVEEFLDGFLAAERGGELLACGGVEI